MKLSLFIHVICVSTLFGGLSVMAMYLRDSIKTGQNQVYALNKVHKWNLSMFIPITVLALISGLFMLFAFGDGKPIWLLIKERAGTLILLSFIILIPTYGKQLVNQAKDQMLVPNMKKYIMMMNTIVLLMAIMIFVVTFKF